jgi:hypothetical protein
METMCGVRLQAVTFYVQLALGKLLFLLADEGEHREALATACQEIPYQMFSRLKGVLFVFGRRRRRLHGSNTNAKTGKRIPKGFLGE